MKHTFYILTITFCLFIGHNENINAQKSIDNIQELRSELVNNNSKKITVVSHRGDWRNAPENSLQAIQNCIDMGVDMVEIDLHETKDGELVLMHDKTVNRTTNGKGLVSDFTLDSLKTLRLKNGLGRVTLHEIPTLKEAMLVAKGKILINLDKAYPVFDKAFKILQETGTTDQVVIKGSVPVEQIQKEFGQYLDKIIYMPIVNINAPNAMKIIKNYNEQLHPFAYELTFSKIDDNVYKAFKFVQDNGSKVWVNSLWASLNGGYEDDLAVQKTDSIYGWYLKNDIKIIQTDRPQLMLEYLKTNDKH